MSVEEEGKRLLDSGYRCTSNRHRIVSRIDREDWREHMASKHMGGMEWVNILGYGAGDHYRRVYSRDSIEGLPQPVYDYVKKHGGSHGNSPLCEYLPKVD